MSLRSRAGFEHTELTIGDCRSADKSCNGAIQMKNTLLSAAGAFVLAVVTFSGGAQAQCFWTGYNWSCPTSSYYYPHPYAGTAYPAWNAWDFQDYRLRPDWL